MIEIFNQVFELRDFKLTNLMLENIMTLDRFAFVKSDKLPQILYIRE